MSTLSGLTHLAIDDLSAVLVSAEPKAHYDEYTIKATYDLRSIEFKWPHRGAITLKEIIYCWLSCAAGAHLPMGEGFPEGMKAYLLDLKNRCLKEVMVLFDTNEQIQTYAAKVHALE